MSVEQAMREVLARKDAELARLQARHDQLQAELAERRRTLAITMMRVEGNIAAALAAEQGNDDARI